jgi:hypothetical protein
VYCTWRFRGRIHEDALQCTGEEKFFFSSAMTRKVLLIQCTGEEKVFNSTLEKESYMDRALEKKRDF